MLNTGSSETYVDLHILDLVEMLQHIRWNTQTDWSVCRLHRDGLEDPLDDAGLVQQQLDQLSTIGRCEYEKTCALLVQLFDQAAQTYQELLQSTNSSAADITVQEGNYAFYSAGQQLCSALSKTDSVATLWTLIETVRVILLSGCKRLTNECLSAGRLTWLVYIIGAVIGGRVSFASTDEQDAMDGELVCR